MKVTIQLILLTPVICQILSTALGQYMPEEGKNNLYNSWKLRPGVEVPVQSAGYPEEALGNTFQSWKIRTSDENIIKLTCYEIRLTKLQDGSCQSYIFTVNDDGLYRDYCGGHYDMTTLSNSNYLELTFRTGLYASGYVNCTVQAIEKSIDFVQRTTTTTEIIPIDSVEIDSSEHGGPKGDKSTNCSCGWANKEFARVIGGRETAVNEYPFNVALTGRGHKFPTCGGSIITPFHVLTCAHCVFKQKAANIPIAVTVGEHDWTKDDESNYTQQINVIFIDMHPGYQGNEPNFDIAVLVLEKKIEYNQFVGPVCLPNRQLNLVGDHVKVIGWGRTQSYGAGSFFVKKTNVKVLPLVECARAFPRHVDLANPHLICTYSKMKGIGLGDSGGPVVWLDPETNRYTVVGLPALVRLYLGENHYVPDMSTDVSSYIDWIAKSVDSTVPSVSTCSANL